MKKKIKKLALCRETLANLSGDQFGHVAGGVITQLCSNGTACGLSYCVTDCAICDYTFGCTAYPACELTDSCDCATMLREGC